MNDRDALSVQDALSVLTLRPLPASEWLTEDSTGWSSRVNLPMPAVLVESVRLNGKALDFLPSATAQVVVWPKVPREAGRLEIRYRTDVPSGAASSRPTALGINDQGRVATTVARSPRIDPGACYGFLPAGAQP